MDFARPRKNILDPRPHLCRHRSVCAGRVALFAVQDFSQSVPDLSVEQQEQKVFFFAHRAGIPLGQRDDGARKHARQMQDSRALSKNDDPI